MASQGYVNKVSLKEVYIVLSYCDFHLVSSEIYMFVQMISKPKNGQSSYCTRTITSRTCPNIIT